METDCSVMEIEGPGLEAVAKQPGLKRLNLKATRVTDQGLSYLKNLTSLTSLQLSDLITGKGLIHLKDNTKLTT